MSAPTVSSAAAAAQSRCDVRNVYTRGEGEQCERGALLVGPKLDIMTDAI